MRTPLDNAPALFHKLFGKPVEDMRVFALSRADWQRELPQLIRLGLVKTGETYDQYLERLSKFQVFVVPNFY